MTTYEQGRAPEGAPVTWRNVVHEGCEIVLDSGAILRELHASDADAICRAFHFAKLAEDYVRAADAMDGAPAAPAAANVEPAWRVTRDALLRTVRRVMRA